GVGGDVVDDAAARLVEQETPVRRGGAAVGQARARNRHAGRCVLERRDLLLLEVRSTDEPARALAAAAPAQVRAPGVTARQVEVVAVVQLHAGALDILAGDDVDHAGDG